MINSGPDFSREVSGIFHRGLSAVCQDYWLFRVLQRSSGRLHSLGFGINE